MPKPSIPDNLALFKNQLKESQVKGVYIFCGEEDFLKNYYLLSLQTKLLGDMDTAVFDRIPLCASDKQSAESLEERLVSAVLSPPVMCEYKLIEVRDLNFDKLKKNELDALCETLLTIKDYDYAVTIFLCTPSEFATGYRWDVSPQYKTLNKAGATIVNFAKQSPAKLVPWCRKHFQSEGIKAQDTVINQLIDWCGDSMFSLCGEIDKLCAYVKAADRDTVRAEDINLVCVRVEESVSFGLSNALKNRDVTAALHEYRLMRFTKTDPVVLLGMITSTAGDLYKLWQARADGLTPAQMSQIFHLHEYVVKITLAAAALFSGEELERLMQLCFQTDYQLKHSPVDNDILLERLIAAFGKTIPAKESIHLS